MPNITQIPALRVAFIDPNTGLISREWYRFLLNLFTLTGNGSSDVSITDLMVGPSAATAEAQIAELQKAIQALQLMPNYEPPTDVIRAVQSRLQDLEVGPSLSGLLSDIANLQTAQQNAAITASDSSLRSDIAVLQSAVQALNLTPSFVFSTMGTVTSVDGSGGTTGLTLTGGPITTAGTLTLGGTLTTANGGTGSTSTTFVNLASNVTGTLPVANGGTGSTSLTGAGIVTITDTQTVTGVKAFANANNTFYGLNYSTSDGGTGANSYWDETGAYGRIGGTNGLILATGGPYPGTSRFVADPSTFRPFADNAYALGTASFRYTIVYATTGTINTSDGTQKQQIAALTFAEHSVARQLKTLIRTFKFNDAVELKSDGARIHVGVIAQDVRDAFIAGGLDPNKYGLFCSDTWTENNIEHTRLGIRYDQLLAFIIAAL